MSYKRFDMDLKGRPIKPSSTKPMQKGGSEDSPVRSFPDDIIWQEACNTGIFGKIDAKADWQSVQIRIGVSDRTTLHGHRVWTPFMRFAAAFMLTVGVAAALYVVLKPAEQTDLAADVMKKADRLPVDIQLPDGSVVTLKGGSSISYDGNFGKKFRDIRLTGEALFDVKHNAAVPFRVLSGASMVLVTGTRFSVRQEDDNVKVSVLSGTVLLSENREHARQIRITANQSGYLSDNALKVEEGIEVNELSWKTGHLIFNETPIDSALMDVAHHFSRQLILGTPIDEDITAEFQNQNLREILDELGLVADLKFDTTGNKLMVSK